MCCQDSSSLYDRLKVEIGKIHNIPPMNVDIFNLKDAEGGVDIRYNCHSSPYYTAPRLDGLMLQSRSEVRPKTITITTTCTDIFTFQTM